MFNYAKNIQKIIIPEGIKVIPDKAQSTRFFYGVGENDDAGRKDNQAAFVEEAKILKIDVVGKVYPKFGHETNETIENDIMKFFIETNSKQ